MPFGGLEAALLGLNLLGTGAKYYGKHQEQKASRRLGRARFGFQRGSLERQRQQEEEDQARRRGALRESLFARGIGESSIAQNELGYLDRTQGRERTQLSERQGLLGTEYSAFRRQLKRNRMMGYLDLGLGLGNALGGAAFYGRGAQGDSYDRFEPTGGEL